jgi:predicted ATP-dependent serine protease
MTARVQCLVCRRGGDAPGPPRCPTCGARAPWVPVEQLAPATPATPEKTAPAPARVRFARDERAERETVPAIAKESAKTSGVLTPRARELAADNEPMDRHVADTEPAPAIDAGDDADELQIVDAAEAAAGVDEPTRVLTLPDVDRVLGGGLCRGRVLLLGGDRGSGKSRLLTQMLGVATGVFASAEETTDDSALRAKQVIGIDLLQSGRVKLVQIPAASGVDAFVRLVRRVRPVIAVLDSLQAVAGENTRPQGAAMIALWQLARETTADGEPGTAIVVMSQMNGDGGLRGSKAIEQWCDVIAMVEPIEGRKGYRRLHCAAKNRYGSEEEEAIFRHTPGGLVPASLPVDDEKGSAA